MAVGLACLVLGCDSVRLLGSIRSAFGDGARCWPGRCDFIRQGGAVALVDCGLDERVVAALVRNNVHHIDAVFVTHWDEDHWGGLPAVLEQFSVGTIAVAADALEDAPTEVLNRPGVTYRQVRSRGYGRYRLILRSRDVAI